MFITDSAIMNFSKLRSSNKIWIVACSLYLGFLIFISNSAYLKSLSPLLLRIPFADIFLHFLLLGFAAFFSHLALNKRYVMVFGIFLPLAPLIIILCCIVDEMLQALSPNRTSSFLDLMANLVGITLFYFLAKKVRLKS